MPTLPSCHAAIDQGVVDPAKKSGVDIDWRDHAKIGTPVTLTSLATVWLWLA